jgi:hypothetical protein
MRIGAPYKVLNTVVEFDEPHRIAWRHFSGHIWRYTLRPVPGGTLVTEEWDPNPSRWPWLLVGLGFGGRNRIGMEKTLERLAALVSR